MRKHVGLDEGITPYMNVEADWLETPVNHLRVAVQVLRSSILRTFFIMEEWMVPTGQWYPLFASA